MRFPGCFGRRIILGRGVTCFPSKHRGLVAVLVGRREAPATPDSIEMDGTGSLSKRCKKDAPEGKMSRAVTLE